MESLQNGIQDTCADNNFGSVPGYLFLTLINALFGAKCSLGSKKPYPEDYGPKLTDNESFDFIIVGAGSSGSVLANKLSENGKYKVLILEAGGYPNALHDIPSMFFSALGTDADWAYTTEPNDNHCKGLKNASCVWPRGKVLGGCSAVNAMLYVRGNRRDYDEWAKEGNTGWDWKSVLENFNAIENLQADDLKGLNSYGTEGLLPLTKYAYSENIRTSLRDAFETLGIPKLPQENPYKPIGVLDAVQNIQNGERTSAAKAFLGSAKHRNNLFLAINAHVTKITIDGNSKTATGVEVAIGTKRIQLRATKEVILSAGAINTPQLLLLSGVGPKQHLQQVGIDVIHDLPVGEDLQDHVVIPVAYQVDETAVQPKPPTYALDHFYQYLIHRKGDFSEIRITNLMSFIDTKNESEYPNIQIHFIVNDIAEEYLLQELIRTQGQTEEMAKQQESYSKNSAVYYNWVTLLNPKSRGKISLKNNDPFEKPIIDAGYLTDRDNEDLQTLLEGARFAQKLVQTDPMRKHKSIVPINVIPSCPGFDENSDDYWKCLIRHVGTTLYHPTSSARMGVDPKTSVVDSRLRVHGIKNLRVADASIMPKITSGNTNAPSMMIGHKAGDLILEDWTQAHCEL